MQKDKSIAGESEELLIEIKDLKKSFGKNKVLNGLDLTLFKGENLVVLGRSGSGKSVLIKCISRLIDADHGSINVFGKDVMKARDSELKEIRRNIGFLFQGAAKIMVEPHATAWSEY